MGNPLISVIIPVYNGSRTLRRCLDSVLQSAFPSYECIVVDDHSGDDSSRIAQSFGVRVIRLDGQQGAAYARNRGAEAAGGDILFFVDADVILPPDCMEKVVKAFEENPEASAVFGSYDDQPGSPNFLSQYRNLMHHYIHQTSESNASTFWTACGAIRKEIFFSIGKFNEQCRMMEDIELGYRLHASKYKIVLEKELVVKHLKHYSFFSLLRTDLFDRAIPWTVLLLRHKQVANDLNLKSRHKLSAVVVMALIICTAMAFRSTGFAFPIPVLLFIFLVMNRDLYGFFLNKRGITFTMKVIPLHALYYLYSVLGFVMGHGKYYLDGKNPKTPGLIDPQ